MAIIDNLISSSSSPEELSRFIENNSTKIYDFFISQSYESLEKHKARIQSYILPYYKVYKELDFTKSRNKTYILLLLDVSERFGSPSEFQDLYKLCKRKNIIVGSRLEASSKFLVGIKRVSDYSDRMPEILDLLASSYLNEEDSPEKVIATLIHFYTEVLHNFGNENLLAVKEFRELLFEKLSDDDKKFLINSTVTEILIETIEDIELIFKSIHQKLDLLLDRSREFLPFDISSHLIELDTEYSLMLGSIQAKFLEIRNLCASLYANVASDDIFYSLQRGVKVLTEQNQLLAYINSYGKMHYAKVMSAFSALSSQTLVSSIEIYDWGCGQGLASVCFLEYLEDRSESIDIEAITLIEPSEIALKRASLHIKKFNNSSGIYTINKDLDSLNKEDFSPIEKNTKIQLFSNILDIDFFSMTDLILKIKERFKGLNFFICVSPYVSESKTQRLDDFVEAFESHSNFELIKSVTECKGEWIGTNWTKVVRVFKVIL
jgi:hypothetical protein